MQNLYRRFDWHYIGQIIGRDFAKFYGLLRIYERYINCNFLQGRNEGGRVATPTKGKLISKWFFGVFTFFWKANEDKWINSKVEFIRFLEENSSWKHHFEFVWPLAFQYLILRIWRTLSFSPSVFKVYKKVVEFSHQKYFVF